MGKSCVYLIKCVATGKQYVGSTRDTGIRWKEHRYDLRHDQHDNPHLQHAWNKHGESKFEWSVLEEVVPDDDALRVCEKKWIDILHPEFNISGEAYPTRLGAKNSEAHAHKFSASMKQAWANKTTKQREEWSRGIRRAAKKRKSVTPFQERRREANRKYKSKLKAERAPEREARRVERERKKQEWDAGKEMREMERRRKISEHNRGKSIPKDVREKIRQSVTKRWRDDSDYRERHQEATLEAMQNPETLKRLSDSHKDRVFSEEQKHKMSEAQRRRRDRERLTRDGET